MSQKELNKHDCTGLVVTVHRDNKEASSRCAVEVGCGETSKSMSHRAIAPLLIYCIDASGSMKGSKMEWVRRTVTESLRYRNTGDGCLFAIVMFNNDAKVLVPVTAQDESLGTFESTEARLESELTADGSTNLIAGLKCCGRLVADQLKKKRQVAPHICIFTDGQPDETDAKAMAQSLAEYDKLWPQIGVTAIGYRDLATEDEKDPGVNWALLGSLVDRAGTGTLYSITSETEIIETIGYLFGTISQLVASPVELHVHSPWSQLNVDLNDRANVGYGHATLSADGRTLDVKWSQMSAGQRKWVFLEAEPDVQVSWRYGSVQTGKLTTKTCEPATGKSYAVLRFLRDASHWMREETDPAQLKGRIDTCPKELAVDSRVQRALEDLKRKLQALQAGAGGFNSTVYGRAIALQEGSAAVGSSYANPVQFQCSQRFVAELSPPKPKSPEKEKESILAQPLTPPSQIPQLSPEIPKPTIKRTIAEPPLNPSPTKKRKV